MEDERNQEQKEKKEDEVEIGAKRNIIGPRPTRIVQQMEPYNSRRCTDVCCLIIGLVFSICIVASALSLKNPLYQQQISRPSDSSGKVCGYDYPTKPYLNFTSSPTLATRVCLAQCPSNTHKTVNLNGNLCMPRSKLILHHLSLEDRISNRYFFFLEYDRFYLILAAALVLSILYYMFMRCCPGILMHLTFFLSMIAQIVLGVIFYLYTRQNLEGKVIIMVCMFTVFILALFQVLLYKQALRIQKVFIHEAKKFISERRRIFMYVPFFMLITTIFLLLIYMVYSGYLSIGKPLQVANNIYYEPNHTGFLVTVPITLLYMVWGVSCIKELFSFFVNVHVIHYFYQVEGSAFSLAFKLCWKHMGSIFAAAFINIFLLFPSVIYDSFRNCFHAKFQKSNCCNVVFDMVRSDAIPFTILTGTPYCNAAKYCQYFWYQSMTTDKTSSSLRVYKICAHVLISVAATVAGLFKLGVIEGSIIYFDLIFGMIIATYFISLPMDVTETIRLLYMMEEEGYKRRDDFIKYNMSVLSRTDQVQFLKDIEKIYSSKEVAQQVAKIRKDDWNITNELEEEEEDKKKKGKAKKKRKKDEKSTKPK